MIWSGHLYIGFPVGASGKESACQFRRHGFDPWVGKIAWSRNRQPTPVLLRGEFHGQRSLVGYSPWFARVGHNWVTEHILTYNWSPKRERENGKEKNVWGHNHQYFPSSISSINFCCCCCCCVAKSCPALLQLHGLQLARLFCRWNFPGKDTAVDCRFLLQGIFSIQELNPRLLHWQADSLPSKPPVST